MVGLIIFTATVSVLLPAKCATAEMTDSCSAGWILFNSTCYHLSLEPANWSTAQSSCLEKGGHLLSLRSDRELLPKQEMIGRLSQQKKWWVDLPKNSTSDMTGILMWNIHEANNKGLNEGCGAMNSNGLLRGLQCDQHLLYVCEKLSENNTGTDVCGTGWILISPSCYKLSKQRISWSGARVSCVTDGGNLLTLRSVNQRLQLKKEMERVDSNADWWIGLHKTAWQWLEEPPPVTRFVMLWDVSEPSNSGGVENCGLMYPHGFLNDAPCGFNGKYICKKYLNIVSNTTDCGTGWSLISSTCYAVSTQTGSWEAAKMTCKNKGGNLLSLSSLDELIMKMMGQAGSYADRWWVGLRRTPPSSNTWEWLEAPPIFTPLVTLWNIYEPANQDGNEACGKMSQHGLLHAVPCKEVHFYICENHVGTLEDCHTGWVTIRPSCYNLSTQELTWPEAQARCKGYGGNLLSVSSLEELVEIKKKMQSTSLDRHWWVSMRKLPPENTTWRWLEVSALALLTTNKSSDTPFEENCVEMNSEGLLQSIPCNLSLNYICEKQSGGLTVRRALRNEDCLLARTIDYRPHVVIVMLGDNDLPRMTAAEVSEELERFMTALRDKLPLCRFLFFSVLPRPHDIDYTMKARELHDITTGWKGREGVLYFYHRDQRFSLTKPVSSGNFLPDQVHLCPAGYRTLYRSVQNV